MKFLFGVIGGAAPEILRLYKARTSAKPQELTSLFYWITTIGFLALAGAVAQLVASNNDAAAFAAGLQTPFVIRGLESAGSTRKNQTGIEELSTNTPTALQLAGFRLRKQVRYLKFR